MVLGAVLAACGSGGATPPSAKSLLAEAKRDAIGSGWVHESLTASEPGQHFVMTNEIGSVDGRQDIVRDGAHAMVLVIGDTAYIRGNALAISSYFELTKTRPQRYANTWIEIRSTDAGYRSVSAAVTLSSDFANLTFPPSLRTGPDRTLDGRRVIPLVTTSSGPSGTLVSITLYVTDSSAPLPVELLAVDGRYRSVETWSGWGRAASIVAPTSSLPIGRVTP